MKKINAQIIADSKNEFGNRITTFVLTYPRFIHAELLTHRMFSRNAASSRAIPAKKMIEDIENDPFIPVAWQKSHSGMQGTEYFDKRNIKENADEIVLKTDWLLSSKVAIRSAKILNERGVTKQLINRILEPYQWYTSIVTATEYDNFFELRCPQYEYGEDVYKSRKDVYAAPEYTQAPPSEDNGWIAEIEEKPKYLDNDLDWLKINKGQGEIHISLLAEAMWDAINESTPKELKAGQWHVPFGDKFEVPRVQELFQGIGGTIEDYKIAYEEYVIKIATARCARVSYNNFEGKDDYEADIKLYDRLLESGHYSPFEHCARSMSEMEYASHINGIVPTQEDSWGILNHEYYPIRRKKMFEEEEELHPMNENNGDRYGWSGNFRGFVQLRQIIQ